MDDLQRRRLRRTAKWLHWIAQILIGVMLLVRILLPDLMVEYGDIVMDSMSTRQLMTPSHALSNTILNSSWERYEEIANFLPPSDSKKLEEWVTAVENYYDQEIAVFHYDGKTVRWLRLPEQFAEIQSRLEGLLKTGITCTEAAPNVRRMGTIFFQRATFDTLDAGAGDSYRDSFSSIIAGTGESKVRWGIIYNHDDAIYPFVRRLEKLKTERPFIDEMTIIDGMFHLRRHPNQQDKDSIDTHLFGLRIYEEGTDSLLFESPDLDTTNYKYHHRTSGFPWWIEVYDSDRGEMRRQEILDMIGKPDGKWPWGTKIAFHLFIMFVLAMLYRFVLRATKAEP